MSWILRPEILKVFSWHHNCKSFQNCIELRSAETLGCHLVQPLCSKQLEQAAQDSVQLELESVQERRVHSRNFCLVFV